MGIMTYPLILFSNLMMVEEENIVKSYLREKPFGYKKVCVCKPNCV